MKKVLDIDQIRDRNRKRIPDDVRRKIFDAHLAGKPQKEIADMFDIAHGSVTNIVREFERPAGKWDNRNININSEPIQKQTRLTDVEFRIARIERELQLNWDNEAKEYV